MHTLTGVIRKAPYTKDGQNAKGKWKMYAIEMSESYKTKDGERKYTNYRITMFASEAQIGWYDEAFQEGKVISVSGDSLVVNEREHNGKVYITLEFQNPRLMFSQRGGESEPQQQQQRQQPQPQQQRQQPQQQSQFDDDIPF
ncbi:putative ssDNA binding protein [Klebsiella phage vB_KpnD_Opt-79]|uniref:Single-stranded DNA-binding protein n=1 Tax=Escherichia phage vB_EcoD_Sadiya TaxID=2902684 RepID=A0AC61TRI0_9CAUD|nr:single-stranded DNA-binding protein [Escherichia phage vB_EcoD_Opt-719]UGO52803.1 putative ssDNA binding protein [Klebsiella phage vB_KpnD_Opt-79]UGV22557.1 putative single-stranded DNA-binding protein [Escherichia phage vB_ EcoD_Phleasolo]UGV22725.1 single-stranded DNA-binding protein [Escherichia phage vB_EcoD_Sadiya]